MGRVLPTLQARWDGGRVTAWRRTERRVAADRGGTCVPVTWRAHGDAPDIAHNRLSLEVKHRAALPAWLTDALERTRSINRDGAHPDCRLARLRGTLRRCAVRGGTKTYWRS